MLRIATERRKALVDWKPGQSCNAGEICWLDLQQPSAQELHEAGQLSRVPKALLTTAADTRTSIKTDAEEGWMMMVTRAADFSDGLLKVQHLGIIVNDKHLITIHETELPDLEDALHDWEIEPTSNAPTLLYFLLDAMIDRLFPILDDVEDNLYETEASIIGNMSQSAILQNILRTGRQLLMIRRISSALRETANSVLRRTPQHDASWSGFQEAYDHANRVIDLAEMLHDVSSNSLDAHLATVSNQLNSVMKTLTILSTILMTMALIAGIFGMNFAFPGVVKEQSLRGFWLTMVIMVASAGALLVWFRRKRYLD